MRATARRTTRATRFRAVCAGPPSSLLLLSCPCSTSADPRRAPAPQHGLPLSLPRLCPRPLPRRPPPGVPALPRLEVPRLPLRVQQPQGRADQPGVLLRLACRRHRPGWGPPLAQACVTPLSLEWCSSSSSRALCPLLPSASLLTTRYCTLLTNAPTKRRPSNYPTLGAPRSAPLFPLDLESRSDARTDSPDSESRDDGPSLSPHCTAQARDKGRKERTDGLRVAVTTWTYHLWSWKAGKEENERRLRASGERERGERGGTAIESLVRGTAERGDRKRNGEERTERGTRIRERDARAAGWRSGADLLGGLLRGRGRETREGEGEGQGQQARERRTESGKVAGRTMKVLHSSAVTAREGRERVSLHPTRHARAEQQRTRARAREGTREGGEETHAS